MAKVIWAPSALDDIDSIAHYISRDSAYHASLFIDRLFEAADQLLLNNTARAFPATGLNSNKILLPDYNRPV